MMDLWMKTFQDSKDYVNLVFNTYYNPKYVRTVFEGDRLVASLLGVEYKFAFREHSLKALYLCGLATHPDFRNKGLMTGLMQDIEEEARKDGFAFTFLIPADKRLHEYYRERGYYEGIYDVVLSYTSIHDFQKEYFSLIENGQIKIADIKKRYYNTLRLSTSDPCIAGNFRESVLDFILNCESASTNMHLYHSRKDLEAVIDENRISKGDMVIVEDADGNIVAIGFVTLSGDRGEARVLKIYSSSIAAHYKCLGFIKSKYSERSLKVYTSANSRKNIAVMDKGIVDDKSNLSSSTGLSFFEEPVSLRTLAKCYGMIKILNLNEILKFQAQTYKTCKFSILVKDSENNIEWLYKADKGYFKDWCIDVSAAGTAENDILSDKGHKRNRNKKNINTKEEEPMALSQSGIFALLCRRPDADNLIMEAFGVPALNIDMSLLLD